MKTLLLIAVGIAAITGGVRMTHAADGCSYDYSGQLRCLPGAEPGVPYGYYRYEDEGGYYRRGHRRSLAYYCSLGRQTPVSLRAECRRRGYW